MKHRVVQCTADQCMARHGRAVKHCVVQCTADQCRAVQGRSMQYNYVQVWYVECFTGIFACNAAFSLLLLMVYYFFNPKLDCGDAVQEAVKSVCRAQFTVWSALYIELS